MPRKREYPRPRGQADDIGSTAIRSILSDFGLVLADIAIVAKVHATAAGRWLYGIRPAQPSAKRLREKYPEHITAEVMTHWGY